MKLPLWQILTFPEQKQLDNKKDKNLDLIIFIVNFKDLYIQ